MPQYPPPLYLPIIGEFKNANSGWTVLAYFIHHLTTLDPNKYIWSIFYIFRPPTIKATRGNAFSALFSAISAQYSHGNNFLVLMAPSLPQNFGSMQFGHISLFFSMAHHLVTHLGHFLQLAHGDFMPQDPPPLDAPIVGESKNITFGWTVGSFFGIFIEFWPNFMQIKSENAVTCISEYFSTPLSNMRSTRGLRNDFHHFQPILPNACFTRFPWSLLWYFRPLLPDACFIQYLWNIFGLFATAPPHNYSKGVLRCIFGHFSASLPNKCSTRYYYDIYHHFRPPFSIGYFSGQYLTIFCHFGGFFVCTTKAGGYSSPE